VPNTFSHVSKLLIMKTNSILLLVACACASRINIVLHDQSAESTEETLHESEHAVDSFDEFLGENQAEFVNDSLHQPIDACTCCKWGGGRHKGKSHWCDYEKLEKQCKDLGGACKCTNPGCKKAPPLKFKVVKVEMCLTLKKHVAGGSKGHHTFTIKSHKGSTYSSTLAKQQSFEVSADIRGAIASQSASGFGSASVAYKTAMQSTITETSSMDQTYEETTYIDMSQPCYIYQGKTISTMDDGSVVTTLGAFVQTNVPETLSCKTIFTRNAR